MSKPRSKGKYPNVTAVRPQKIEKVVIELSPEQAKTLRHLMYFTSSVPEALEREKMFSKEFSRSDLFDLMTDLHTYLVSEMESI